MGRCRYALPKHCATTTWKTTRFIKLFSWAVKNYFRTLLCVVPVEKGELWLYCELYFPTGCNAVRAERDAASAVASQYGNFPAAGSLTTLAE